MIKWNKVTWYSQVVAIILFVIVFFLGFLIGKQFGIVSEYQASKEAEAEANVAYQSTASEDSVINTASFMCDAKKSIQAQFFSDRVHLILSDGRDLLLLQGTSGERYSNTDESIVFSTKGSGSFLEEGSTTTYANCISQG